MAKANKDGWIRHGGGKCPVEKGTLIDVKFRGGRIESAIPALDCPESSSQRGAIEWRRFGYSMDIMQWRLSKTEAEQQEPTIMTAEQIRIQYIENLASIADLHKHNAALVDDLRKLGFDFHEAPKEPQEDMSDPKNWRVGDKVEVISKDVPTILPHGSIQEITKIKGETIYFTDICGGYQVSIDHILKYFKFHSRPTK